VPSCSLEVFLFCYSVLKSPEKIYIKNSKKEKKKEAKKKRARDNIEWALYVFFFSFVR
jgi:polyferredoxin